MRGDYDFHLPHIHHSQRKATAGKSAAKTAVKDKLTIASASEDNLPESHSGVSLAYDHIPRIIFRAGSACDPVPDISSASLKLGLSVRSSSRI